jgi:hypothetical protein
MLGSYIESSARCSSHSRARRKGRRGTHSDAWAGRKQISRYGTTGTVGRTRYLMVLGCTYGALQGEVAGVCWVRRLAFIALDSNKLEDRASNQNQPPRSVVCSSYASLLVGQGGGLVDSQHCDPCGDDGVLRWRCPPSALPLGRGDVGRSRL